MEFKNKAQSNIIKLWTFKSQKSMLKRYNIFIIQTTFSPKNLRRDTLYFNDAMLKFGNSKKNLKHKRAMPSSDNNICIGKMSNINESCISINKKASK